MTPNTTALILIGYQNDYYRSDGVLHGFLEGSDYVRQSLATTLSLIERLTATAVTMIETPIVFTDDYSELRDPVGILAAIRDLKAFRAGQPGSARVREFEPYRERILSVPGKRGMNAFVGTRLEEELRERQIDDVVLLGSVASICIDSTGRFAAERGYRVHFVSDCITGRTLVELDIYLKTIFPLYGRVISSSELVDQLCNAES
jgi:nicotinamidase-related amidase